VLGRELRCCELCLVRRLSLCLGHSVGRGALGIGRSSTALRGLLLGGALGVDLACPLLLMLPRGARGR